MPKKLPPLIKLLTKNVPWYYKPAVASAVFPALGAHLHGVKFRYWDNVEHEATFMNLLVGRQSIGKGSIKKPIDYIMEDIHQRDQPNREREAEWKRKNPTGKQKKDPRPADICIQMLIDNLTDAVFNQRIVDAHNNGERYIFTIVDEVEALKNVPAVLEFYMGKNTPERRFSVSGVSSLWIGSQAITSFRPCHPFQGWRQERAPSSRGCR